MLRRKKACSGELRELKRKVPPPKQGHQRDIIIGPDFALTNRKRMEK